MLVSYLVLVGTDLQLQFTFSFRGKLGQKAENDRQSRGKDDSESDEGRDSSEPGRVMGSISGWPEVTPVDGGDTADAVDHGDDDCSFFGWLVHHFGCPIEDDWERHVESGNVETHEYVANDVVIDDGDRDHRTDESCGQASDNEPLAIAPTVGKVGEDQEEDGADLWNWELV